MITLHVNITKMKIKFVLSVYNKLYSLGKLFMIHFCVNLVYLFFLYHGFLVFAFKLGGGGQTIQYVLSVMLFRHKHLKACSLYRKNV